METNTLQGLEERLALLTEAEEWTADPQLLHDLQIDITAALVAAQEKRDRFALYLQSLAARIQAREAMIGKLKAANERDEKVAEQLAEYGRAVLLQLGVNELVGKVWRLKLRRLPDVVEITDQAAIPEVYWREKVTLTIDKIALKEALKHGAVPGADLAQNRTKLEVRA